MSSLKFSVKLVDTDSYVRSEILSGLQKILSKAINKCINNIESKIKSIIRSALQNEPEYNSLISGELRREFGIENTSNVDLAIDNMLNSIIIESAPVSISSVGLSGGIILKIIPKELVGIIDQSSAFVVDSERGYSLPWLEWLLTKGGSIIVRNFEVKYGANPRSRSGDAIMISSGSSWRVPPQFAGTTNNNWITRALSTTENKILQLLRSEFEKSL